MTAAKRSTATAKQLLESLLQDDVIQVRPSDRERFMRDWEAAMDQLADADSKPAPEAPQAKKPQLKATKVFGGMTFHGGKQMRALSRPGTVFGKPITDFNAPLEPLE